MFWNVTLLTLPKTSKPPPRTPRDACTPPASARAPTPSASAAGQRKGRPSPSVLEHPHVHRNIGKWRYYCIPLKVQRSPFSKPRSGTKKLSAVLPGRRQSRPNLPRDERSAAPGPGRGVRGPRKSSAERSGRFWALLIHSATVSLRSLQDCHGMYVPPLSFG